MVYVVGAWNKLLFILFDRLQSTAGVVTQLLCNWWRWWWGFKRNVPSGRSFSYENAWQILGDWEYDNKAGLWNDKCSRAREVAWLV
jgi:hypothetical protein